MKNSTYVKLIRGEATELDKRILIGDIGYEIVIGAKGYQLEDRAGSGINVDKVFDDIDSIIDHLQDRMDSEFGDSFTKEQKEALKFESKIVIVVAGIIQDDTIFQTVRTLAKETGSDYLPSYSEDVEKDGFQVSITFLEELKELMKDEVYIDAIGLDKMDMLRQELLEGEMKGLASIDVRIS